MVRKTKLLLIVSICLNIVFLLCVGGLIYKYVKLKSAAEVSFNIEKNVKLSNYHSLNKEDRQKIVLLGDSITQYNDWSEILNNNNIINRGIEGNKTSDVINRLNDITSIKPNKIFIMMGINDLLNNISQSTIINNYQNVISNIKLDSPDTLIYVESVLPINTSIKKTTLTQNSIDKFNSELRKLATKENVKFINVYPLFNIDGNLPKNMTVDGLHLNGNGYQKLISYLKKYIKE